MHYQKCQELNVKHNRFSVFHYFRICERNYISKSYNQVALLPFGNLNLDMIDCIIRV